MKIKTISYKKILNRILKENNWKTLYSTKYVNYIRPDTYYTLAPSSTVKKQYLIALNLTNYKEEIKTLFFDFLGEYSLREVFFKCFFCEKSVLYRTKLLGLEAETFDGFLKQLVWVDNILVNGISWESEYHFIIHGRQESFTVDWEEYSDKWREYLNKNIEGLYLK